MIYLFEDKTGRMNRSMGGRNIPSDVLKLDHIDCNLSELDDYVDNKLSDADAVLFHVSYLFPHSSNLTNDAVRKACLDRHIPFVYFSGGASNFLGKSENKTLTANVRSDDMYKNLLEFLRVYKETGLVNIPWLVFGNSNLLNTMLNVLCYANRILWSYSPDDFINVMTRNDLRSGISSRIQEEELSEDKDSLLRMIKNKEHELTSRMVLDAIQSIIDKY